MYGLVNRAIKDLVIDSHGVDMWVSIANSAGVDPTGFIDLSNYEDKVTFDLVESASNSLGIPSNEILQAFGKHWVLYTGSTEWGYLFDLAGRDFLSMLKGMDNLHARVEAQMPESHMPQFSVVEHDDYVELHYVSQRQGLAPMIAGLLDGLMDHFDEKWTIEHAATQSENGHDIFELCKVEEDVDAYAA